MKRSNQITGNMGLYYVCFKLSELGWNVMPTARNARGIDVICFSADGNRMISIQVKSLSKKPAVPVGEDLDKIVGDFWIIVNSLDSGGPQTYIMLPDEVKNKAVGQLGKNGKIAYWLSRKLYDIEEFKENWQRIGTGI